jgi:small subunit ribosomal protein S20
MPNIKQQERRVRSAARERMQNLRWRSTAKTLYRRLEAAVAEGDEERVEEAHRELVRWLDKAAVRRVLHPNKVARKKSQAARLVAQAKSS